jgi:uncharacterized protein (TIGR02147 family)
METETSINKIKNEYLKRVNKNQAYSLRAFSQLLGISSGALSEIFNGKRKLTPKTAAKMAKALGLNHVESKEFIQSTLNIKEDKSQINNRNTLTKDLFFVVSQWYCFALLNLTKIKNFSWNSKWLIQKLGINQYQLQSAIDSLVKTGLLKRDEKGEIVPTNEHIQTEEDIPSQAVVQYHQSMLQKAMNALEEQPVEDREVAGLGIPISQYELPAVKKEINEFLDHIAEKYGHNEKIKDHVYQLEIAFFKLTNS